DVAGPIDLGHPAGAERRQNLIRAEPPWLEAIDLVRSREPKPGNRLERGRLFQEVPRHVREPEQGFEFGAQPWFVRAGTIEKRRSVLRWQLDRGPKELLQAQPPFHCHGFRSAGRSS